MLHWKHVLLLSNVHAKQLFKSSFRHAAQSDGTAPAFRRTERRGAGRQAGELSNCGFSSFTTANTSFLHTGLCGLCFMHHGADKASTLLAVKYTQTSE